MLYFGPWDDPDGALARFRAFENGKAVKSPRRRRSDSTHAEAPSKPYPDFPLFPHATGRWAKKIRGKTHYFGPWADPDGALARYREQKDALHAGRKPRPDPEALTVKDAANAFLNAKKARLDSGELSPHTWANYKQAADELVAHTGKTRLVADLDPQAVVRP